MSMMTKTPMFLCVFLALLGLRCAKDEEPAATDQKPTASESTSDSASSQAEGIVRLTEAERANAGIQVQQVKRHQSRCALRAMGEVLAPQPRTAIVSHAFPGRVAEIHAGVGDWVEKDKPVVTLESPEVGDAKSEFYKAIANAELAKMNLDREKRLLDGGIGVKKNFLAAEAEHKVAQANLEAAEKRLHVLGFTEEEVEKIVGTHQINPTITLYAPIAGKVVESKAILGAMVDESVPILTVIDVRSLWVDAELYEKDIARMKIGQNVEIRVPAYPDAVFGGKISYIGDMVDEETRTITVRAEVANADQRLKPGMFADVKIMLDESHQMLIAPPAAILEEGKQEFVFVEQGDHFARREIQTRTIDGRCRQVVSGLEPGEKVVIQGNHQLHSKLKEEVLQAAHVH